MRLQMEMAEKLADGFSPHAAFEAKHTQRGHDQAEEPISACLGFPQRRLRVAVAAVHRLEVTMHAAFGKSGLLRKASDALLPVCTNRVVNNQALGPQSHSGGPCSEGWLKSCLKSALQSTRSMTHCPALETWPIFHFDHQRMAQDGTGIVHLRRSGLSRRCLRLLFSRESLDEVLHIHLVEFWHHKRITDSLSVRVERLTLSDLDALKLPQKLRRPYPPFTCRQRRQGFHKCLKVTFCSVVFNPLFECHAILRPHTAKRKQRIKLREHIFVDGRGSLIDQCNPNAAIPA